MSSLVAARTAIVNALTAAPELAGVGVTVHGGDFDLKQLQAYSKQAPHLVLALMSFTPKILAGIVQAEAVWALIAFTVNTPGVLRDASCISLTEAACKVLLRTWGGDPSAAAARPREFRAANQFGGPLDATGVAMWAIEFTQCLDLLEEIETDLWETMHAQWDLSPRDNDADLGEVLEAEDTIEIEQ